MMGVVRHQGVRDDGFAEFYAATRHRCLRAAIATGMSPVAAEDAVAEAYARAFASWSKVRQLDAPIAWVMRTAMNQHISWWRRRRKEAVSLDAGDLESGRDAGSADEGGSDESALDAVAAIRRLPPRQRDVVVLRYLLDLDTATTASVLAIAPGTVTAHLHRALATLRSELGVSRPPTSPVAARAAGRNDR